MSKFKNRILQGDCIELMKSIETSTIDCCITDPPYNISGYDNKKEIGWLKSNKTWTKDKSFNKIDAEWDKFTDDDYENFTLNWLIEVKRILKPNGNIAIFGSYHNIFKIGYLLEKLDLRIINSLVWYKRNAFPNITQRMFCESTEYVIWATNNNKKHAKNWTFNYKKMKEINGGVQMRNMFDIPNTKTSEKTFGKHPSQKPLELINNLIMALTNENDIIIDPFLGSGTTCVSAKRLDRSYIGIEQNEDYFKLAQERINEKPKDKNVIEKKIKTTIKKANEKQIKIF
jgi:site-specific DNA-methyltransferase (adenine-specific)